MKNGLPPILNHNTKILVLGSLPGDASILNREYYKNPQNQFWRIISHIFQVDIGLSSYEAKCSFLFANNIGLWDVLKRAERHGSLDNSIVCEEPNDLGTILSEYPNISLICFNGQKSYKLFTKYHNNREIRQSIEVLPSTSSANTSMTIQRKILIWQKVLAMKSENYENRRAII